MMKLKVLIGMDYETINISSNDYQKLINYGKCITDEEITAKTENDEIVTSSMIDDYIVLTA